MKQTFKKPSYYLLSQAMDGDEKAIEKILAFYDPYISKWCGIKKVDILFSRIS